MTYFILTVSVPNSLRKALLIRIYLHIERKLQNGLEDFACLLYTQHINRYIIHDTDHLELEYMLCKLYITFINLTCLELVYLENYPKKYF